MQDSTTRYIKKLIPKETWHKARAAAILENKTISEWLTETIEEKVKR